jgi:hypothetical protein
VLRGELTVDGAPVALRACRPRHAVHTFVEVVSAAGTLRFEDQKAYWNPVPDAVTRGAELACTRLDRSWGGGVRPDGSAYWRGTLDFVCGRVTAKLTLDCGGITPTERAALDDRR